MATKKVYAVPFRRKREDRTDYKRRLALLKSNTPRLVVRKTNQHILAQLVKYGDHGDVVVASAHTKDLKKFGWTTATSNIPSAYLTGLLLGKTSKGKDAILDLGLQTPNAGSKLYAVLKGAVDGGLKVKHSDKILPAEERVNGTHIAKYAETIKENKEAYEKIFSGYIKSKVDPTKLNEYFEKAKTKILGK